MLFISWLHWVLNFLITAIMVRVFQMLFPETKLALDLGVIH
jgi:hypothetical protein